MGRSSTVAKHPQVSRINSMLDDGVSYSEVSARFGLSLSSVGRHALSRKSELAKLVDSDPSMTDILSRLVEAADHAQVVRKHSKIAGSSVAQARAIKSETEILTKLLGELGVTDLAVAEYFEHSRALIDALRIFARTHPESARDLLTTLEAPALSDLARALKAQIETAS